MSILADIARWFFKLLPANPILLRVVSAGSKRVRHLWARLIYLVVLFTVILVVGGGGLGAESASLAELAKQASNTFMWVSIAQLVLMSLIAPVFTAAAITQEKDANTFHILLTTPLSNAQIVLGTLCSRLFFVWAMLLAGLPIFCVTMLYGGVTAAEVFTSTALAAVTGLVAGAAAISISVMRVGTRRTIFSFFVGVAAYLLGVGAYGLSSYGALPEAPLSPGQNWQMSWLAPAHPLLALFVVTGQTPAPPMSHVYHYGWPWRWLLAYPQYGYMVLATLASMVMVVVSLFFVRRGARQGEPGWLARLREFLFPSAAAGERRRTPRRVWKNPIAWREAATRASTAGRSALRWTFLVGGALLALVLVTAHEKSWWGLDPGKPGHTRDWLAAVTIVEWAVILLVVTSTAATTLTREKETGTLELLLTTPLTSKYIIAGMLRGLVSFVTPMIAVPTFTVLLFAAAGLGHQPDQRVLTVESVLLMPLAMFSTAAAAAMVGLRFSLSQRRTAQAVMSSTAVVLFAAGLLSGWALVLAQAGPTLASIAAAFAPFHAVRALIDLPSLGGGAQQLSASALVELRTLRDLTILIAAAAYVALTFTLYRNLVRDFDMTIRRQTA